MKVFQERAEAACECKNKFDDEQKKSTSPCLGK